MQKSNPKHSLYTQLKSGEKKTEHIVIAIVQDVPGVLSRISGLFRRRNFNIKSFTAGNSGQPGLTRITIIMDGMKTMTEQLVKQLDKIIEVIEVMDITSENPVVRELVLLKVGFKKAQRVDLLQLVERSGGKLIDEMKGALLMELTDEPKKIDRFLHSLKSFQLLEMARTGVTALNRRNAA